MKFTTAKHGFRSLLATLFLFGALLFSAGQAHGQSLSTGNQNWKTVPDAMQTLEGQITQLDGQLANLTPGTPAYDNVNQHMEYYKLIYGDLQDGTGVPEAVFKNVGVVNLSVTDANPQSQATYDQLRVDATALLTY